MVTMSSRMRLVVRVLTVGLFTAVSACGDDSPNHDGTAGFTDDPSIETDSGPPQQGSSETTDDVSDGPPPSTDATDPTDPTDATDPTDPTDATDATDATVPSEVPTDPTSGDFHAVPLDLETIVNEPVDLVLEGVGPTGLALVFEIDDPPGNGQLSGEPPLLTYTPEQDFLGTDTFSFTTGLDSVRSAPAMVTISVIPQPNRPPLAEDIEVDAAQDRDTVIQLLATDPDGDDLTFRIEDQPEHGQVTIEDDLATYTPDAGYAGPDSFTYVASDGELESGPATVTLDVVPMENRPPVAQDMDVSVDQRSSVTFDLTGVDPDGDPLTWEILDQPAHGIISLDGRSVTYTPDTEFHGEDAFTYRVSDGELFSEPATVSITVHFVNRPPVAVNANLTGDQRTSFSRTLTATDPDGDDVTLEIVDEPANGSATLEGFLLTYTPDGDFFGQDQLTFRAFDGELHSEPATVTVTVRYVNRPPVANDVTVTVTQGESTLIPLEATDPDGDNLTYAIDEAPTVGTATIVGSAARLDLTGDPDFHGNVTFTYTANDGQASSDPATVTVTVERNVIPPRAHDMAVATQRGIPLTFDLDGTGDPEATLTFAIEDQPDNGSVSLDSQSVTYTPDADFTGDDTFTFTVSDDETTSEPGTVTITVTPANRPPIAQDITATVPQREGGTFPLEGSDPDGDPIEFQVVEPPEHGTVVIIGDEATYIPNGDFHGEDSFTYRAFDGELLSAPATAIIIVEYVNRPPVSEDVTASTDEGVPVSIPLVATDPDDDPLSFEILEQSDDGTATVEGSNAIFTPDAGFVGETTFSYRASDGTDTSEPSFVTVDVSPRPPSATNGQFAMPAGESALVVGANDGLRTLVEPGTTDVEQLFFSLELLPAQGEVIVEPDGAFTYSTSSTNSPVADEFGVLVLDTFGLDTSITVTITRPAGP